MDTLFSLSDSKPWCLGYSREKETSRNASLTTTTTTALRPPPTLSSRRKMRKSVTHVPPIYIEVRSNHSRSSLHSLASRFAFPPLRARFPKNTLLTFHRPGLPCTQRRHASASFSSFFLLCLSFLFLPCVSRSAFAVRPSASLAASSSSLQSPETLSVSFSYLSPRSTPPTPESWTPSPQGEDTQSFFVSQRVPSHSSRESGPARGFVADGDYLSETLSSSPPVRTGTSASSRRPISQHHLSLPGGRVSSIQLSPSSSEELSNPVYHAIHKQNPGPTRHLFSEILGPSSSPLSAPPAPLSPSRSRKHLLGEDVSGNKALPALPPLTGDVSPRSFSFLGVHRDGLPEVLSTRDDERTEGRSREDEGFSFLSSSSPATSVRRVGFPWISLDRRPRTAPLCSHASDRSQCAASRPTIWPDEWEAASTHARITWLVETSRVLRIHRRVIYYARLGQDRWRRGKKRGLLLFSLPRYQHEIYAALTLRRPENDQAKKNPGIRITHLPPVPSADAT